MNRFLSGGVVAVAAGLAGQAGAAIVFTDVVIEGSLATGASYTTDASGIHFLFPAAVVGDPVDPIRSGNIVITYNVEGTAGETFSEMLLSIAGTLSGSGMIFFNEIVEDLNQFGKVIGSFNAVLSEADKLPYNTSFAFDNATSKMRVKKSFVLAAYETAGFDLAEVTGADQIPSPGTGALLAGAGVLVVAARRRR